MALVSFKINGEKYTMTCNDGQEETLMRIGHMLDKQAALIKQRNGFVPDNQLLAFLAVQAFHEKLILQQRQKQSVNQDEILQRVEHLSKRITTLAEKLK